MPNKLPMRTMTTPIGFLYYANLFDKGKAYDGKPAEHWTATLVLEDGTDLKDLKKAIVEVAKEMWPDRDVVKELREGTLRNPLRTDTTGKKGFPEGATFIQLKTLQQPGVVGPDPTQVLTENDIANGNKVRFTVSIFPYTKGSPNGVTIWMNNCQKCGEGKPFRKPATADFDTIAPAPMLEEEEAII